MSHWTAADIPDLGERVAIVTGANSGLGWQTTLELARHGAAVTMACRDEARGREALDRVRAEVPTGDVTCRLVDLADLGSVRAFADEVTAAQAGIDVLVNNAGVMAVPYRRTADGFESQLATNHLGHFALTGRLLPALLARPAARVVTVSSTVAVVGRIDFDDLQSTRHYFRWQAYAQSKLANQLFAYELARRAEAAGTSLVSVAAHPGYAATNLQTAGPAMSGHRVRAEFMKIGNRLFAQSDADGARPLLYAATAPGVTGGEYFGPDGFFGQHGFPRRVTPPRQARREDTARRLWAVSEELTGVEYRFVT
jgi:NAD(P)-dependent dehydrogenase (short-subunit alcohol dehydrogenase family)